MAPEYCEVAVTSSVSPVPAGFVLVLPNWRKIVIVSSRRVEFETPLAKWDHAVARNG